MGLDFRWGGDVMAESRLRAPRWSYSGFHAFRERLGHQADLLAPDVSIDHWYDRTGSFAYAAGDSWARRSYPSQFNEPLVLLLADCEGDLSPDQCRRLAPRLRELMKDWPADDYDRIHGERLAAACEECARDHLVLEFC
jgi:hypothetical protein